MLFGYGRLKPGERRELTYLLECINPARVEALVEQHLPAVGGGTMLQFHQRLSRAMS